MKNICFSQLSLDISAASTNSRMRSEGVGKMLLYTPTGLLCPGFDNVVFSKQSAEKLASVGDLCDAGMVCVFDKNGLTTYKDTSIEIKGEVFTR